VKQDRAPSAVERRSTDSAQGLRALRQARSAVLRTSDGLGAWKTLAIAAGSAGEFSESARAWIEVSRLEERRGAYVAALRSMKRARKLGASVTPRLGVLRGRLALMLGAPVLSAALLGTSISVRSLWPLGLIALIPLYLCVRSMAPAYAFAYAWVTGLLVNLYGFAWGVRLIERFGHMPLPHAAAAVVAISAYQAIVFGLWAGLSTLLSFRARIPWLVAGPLAIVLAEAVVSFLFPWHLGICVWRTWPMLQVAEIGGPSAVSSLVVLINLVLAETWLARSERARLGRPVRLAAGAAVAIVALGLARAGHIAWIRARARHARVGIVQPNLGVVSADDRKHHGQEYVDALRAGTDALGKRGVELVVWPESAFPFLFDRQLDREFAGSHPWSLRGTYHGPLLLGALTHSFGGSDIYNSALLVAADGRIDGRYDKVHLMPFGEYIPFSDRFPEWAARTRKQLTYASDIVPGPGSTVLSTGPLRIAPMICYEDILPEAPSEIGRASPAPNLLVTLADHAWFGDSVAPRMALALATFRSIELRRDLVRATSTGVSSIGDALGRVSVEGPVVQPRDGSAATPEILDGDVALLDIPAMGPYGGPAFPYACACALAGVVLLVRRTRHSNGTRIRVFPSARA